MTPAYWRTLLLLERNSRLSIGAAYVHRPLLLISHQAATATSWTNPASSCQAMGWSSPTRTMRTAQSMVCA